MSRLPNFDRGRTHALPASGRHRRLRKHSGIAAISDAAMSSWSCLRALSMTWLPRRPSKPAISPPDALGRAPVYQRNLALQRILHDPEAKGLVLHRRGVSVAVSVVVSSPSRLTWTRLIRRPLKSVAVSGQPSCVTLSPATGTSLTGAEQEPHGLPLIVGRSRSSNSLRSWMLIPPSTE